MKILKVSGKNLASLGGEFALDFQSEPLLSTGLFAICGPTGAGKSTLLDALCLALYDATPRLSRAVGKGIGLPDVRDETLTQQDTRNLLRRGCAEAYAEVEFIGNDNLTYRARWSVRRARSREDGALQPVTMAFWQLPELQQIGGTKLEVKAEIERRIGLSFEQFTRAVLLAQNEFSAFLKADDGERGELLETLSGSTIYSEMSKRAFARAKAETEKLNQLGSRLADHAPLDAEARANLEKELQLASESLALLDQKKQKLDEELRWHYAWENLKRDEQQAREEVERLVAEQLTLVTRRRYLARVESIQATRPLMHEWSRAQAATTGLRSELQAAEQKLDAAVMAHSQARLALKEAETAAHNADIARNAATINLDKAKTLDAQIEALQPEYQRLIDALEEARKNESEANQKLANLRQEHAVITDQQKKADAWLSDHASTKSLALHWARWDTLLGQAGALLAERNMAKQSFDMLQADFRSKRQAGEEAQAQLLLAIESVTKAEARRELAVRALAQVDIAGIRERRHALETRRDLIEDADACWKLLFTSQCRAQELAARITHLTQSLEGGATRHAQLSQSLTSARGALEQAQRMQQMAHDACSTSVEEMRASLVQDEPCPVCGSLEHPYAGEDDRLQTVLSTMDREVSAKRTEAEALFQQYAREEASITELRRQLDEAMCDHEAVLASIEDKLGAWQAHPVAAEVMNVSPADRSAWFADLRQAIKAQLLDLSVAESAATAAEKEKDSAQQGLDAALLRRAQLSEALASATAQANKAEAESAKLNEKFTDLERRLTTAIDQLEEAFTHPKWKDSWLKSPADFREKCEQRVAQWNVNVTEHARLGTRLNELDITVTALAENATKLVAAVQSRTAQLAASRERLDEKRAARAMLFGGRAVREVEEELAVKLEQARGQCERQMQALQERAMSATRCRESRDQALQRLSNAEQEIASAHERVNAWIADYNQHADQQTGPLDESSLKDMLAHDADWHARERSYLQHADNALHTAKAVLQERQDRRVAHELLRPSAQVREALQSALATLSSDHESASARTTQLRLALADDEARRARSEAVQAELERQQATARLWGQLGELIGSADGKKFRNYAQQFTLDVLLGYANRHLMELARRYRLERVPNSLALMVVDRDMGEEIRSVHSLSGGESFLVSLALALGLASLSSNRVRVESLFIDEGFGSLDADTLAVAMQALDGLQSMGRKVGVISHVQEMTERIGTKVIVRRVAGGKSVVGVEAA
ncbi:AAA family ATPase [Herbaspirillum sp. GCM10030257]|uniref:AAA family ATPase n=1 Tax=Herbaspirillum sp. GCM10030257 TaxID=3273393 RepID=UPI0036098B8F